MRTKARGFGPALTPPIKVSSPPVHAGGFFAPVNRVRIVYKVLPMHFTSAHLLPIAALVTGVLVLLVPRVLSYVVAVYLIFVGLVGLNGIYHVVK